MNSTPPIMPGKTVLDYVPTWLPVLIAILALLAFGVRADANITEIQEKVVIYDKMIIDSTDRMARVETKLGGIEAGQSRIEAKIDSL